MAYQLIRDLLTLDSTPRLNLASFVTTWMEPEAERLMDLTASVNFVDADEYPSCKEIQDRCVAMLARLFHSPAVGSHGKGKAVGTSTVGSSEAIMLGALSLKKRWQARRKARGLDGPGRPNLVMGAQAHVCWQKFCRYFDVEERYVWAEEGRCSATAALLEALVDENTIGVACILGSTFTGEFEDVQAVSEMLERLAEESGGDIDVFVHVDAASGGFVAPFLYPDLVWDFRLPRVASINVSGHKYGLVYPGVGWCVWRDAQALSEELVFYEDYLGSPETSITLNFSRGAAQIVAQYYQFLRLGRAGYSKIMRNLEHTRQRLARRIKSTGHFEILSPPQGVPLVSFRLLPLSGGRPRGYSERDVADRVRLRGWVIPAYSLPPKLEHVTVLRITIREDLSAQMADQVADALCEAIAHLDKVHARAAAEEEKGAPTSQPGTGPGARHRRGGDASSPAQHVRAAMKPC